MKLKLLVLLLAGVLLISLAACGDGGAQSVVPAENETASKTDNTSAADEAVEEEYTSTIPEAVLNLSEEDDILLNGELKDNVYINNYFGYKLTAPEGMTLYRLNDEATEPTEIIPLKEAYESGYGGIMITTDLGALENVFVNVCAAEEDQIGLGEEEIVKAEIQGTNELAESFGFEPSSEYYTVVLAGEEHPAHLSRSEEDCLDVYMDIIKGEFLYKISVTAPDEERIEYLLSFFEKI